MFRYADNCTEALMLSRTAFFGLYDNYNKLEDTAKDEQARADNESKLRQAAENKATDEKNKKIQWRKAALVEGAVIVIIFTTLLSFL
jgi:hypothetical protein